MFDGIGELLLILVVVLMLFGSKEIPDIARFLGKTMAQLKNATNEIKSEIQKGARDNGVDLDSITGGVSEEINKAKAGISQMVNPIENIDLGIQNPIQEVKENIEDLTGPIKRQS
ncbi:MAG TPA: twin-arginine translocase TatA/TatE family subunit [Flavobacterium sp.]|uniref:twin-arginine translocase TatA/TatE family subunit n=1 Tax=Flavobacterium sp. TaxID=239 RepID=UPI002B4B3CC5|nr:twin-arginine translocase TatA/TatE family subunit [Flavobacterium sp.]HLO72393.1 twin-arginine translocase TatA/TatE family subunit [Flavobacterium sp.]